MPLNFTCPTCRGPKRASGIVCAPCALDIQGARMDIEHGESRRAVAFRYGTSTRTLRHLLNGTRPQSRAKGAGR